MRVYLAVAGVFILVCIGSVLAWILLRENKTGASPDWAQESDYALHGSAEGTEIENASFGVAFPVPREWNIRKHVAGDEFWFSLVRDGAEFSSEGILRNGCAVNTEILVQEAEANAVRNRIQLLKGGREITDSKIRSFGAFDALEEHGNKLSVPLSEGGVLEFSFLFMPPLEQECHKDFDSMLSSIRLEKA